MTKHTHQFENVNFYSILEVLSSAIAEEIKTAYRVGRELRTIIQIAFKIHSTN